MSKKCMLFETLGSITEMKKQKSENANEIRLSGVFGVCGVKNNNRRTYSKENYGQMIECLQRDIMEAGVLGELEHPESMNINLNNVSHKIESVEMLEDGTVKGTILLLNTDKGKNAKAIVEAGVPLYISSRALGNIDGSGNVTLTSLKTYDLVGTPGFSQAKLEALKESNMTYECLNESCVAIFLEEENEDSKEDKKEDKKNDKKEDKKDNKKEEKKDDAKEEINIEVNDQSESEDKEDKNKKDKKENTDMEDLNAKIQTLIDKVDSLEASLHVAKESLEEKTREIAVLKKQLTPNYEAIENWIKEAYTPVLKNELIKQIAEGSEKYINEAFKENNKKTEQWITKEFAPAVESWVTKEFAPMIESWTTQEFAPMVESWITNEFAPIVEGWTTKEFGPMIEGWTTKEFAPMVESWVTREFAPIVEGWVTKEFAPVVENWTITQFGQTLNEWAETEFKKDICENVSEYLDSEMKSINEAKFENIDSMLRAIEGDDPKKVAEQLIESANNKYAGFYAIENMPNEYRPLWEMLSENRKDEIAMMSRAYNYNKNGVLESFWASVSFTETPVKESVVEPQMTFANSIVAQMNRLRKF